MAGSKGRKRKGLRRRAPRPHCKHQAVGFCKPCGDKLSAGVAKAVIVTLGKMAVAAGLLQVFKLDVETGARTPSTVEEAWDTVSETFKNAKGEDFLPGLS